MQGPAGACLGVHSGSWLPERATCLRRVDSTACRAGSGLLSSPRSLLQLMLKSLQVLGWQLQHSRVRLCCAQGQLGWRPTEVCLSGEDVWAWHVQGVQARIELA